MSTGRVRGRQAYGKHGRVYFSPQRLALLPDDGSIYQVAKALGVDPKAVWQWVDSMNCPHTVETIGSGRTQVRIKREPLLAWLVEREQARP